MLLGKAKQFDNRVIHFGGLNGLKPHDTKSERKIAAGSLGLRLYPIFQLQCRPSEFLAISFRPKINPMRNIPRFFQ
jgi:hypothetical protein